MNLVTRKAGAFTRPIVLLFLVESMIQIQYLVNQIFSAQISTHYLNAYSMLSYLGLFSFCLGTALGESCLVVINRNPALHLVRRYFGGAFGVFALSTLLLTAVFCSFETPIKEFLGPDASQISRTDFLIWVAISNLTGANTLFFYFLSIAHTRRKVLIVNFISFAANGVLGALAIKLSSTPDEQFFRLSAAFAFSLAVTFVISLYYLRGQMRFKVDQIPQFMSRCRNLFVGDFLSVFALFSVPLFYSLAIDRTLGVESLASYNMAIRFVEIMFLMMWAIQYSGLSWLLEIWGFRGEPEWHQANSTILKSTLLLVGLPAVVLAAAFPFLLRHAFNLHSFESMVIAVGTILSIIPHVLTSSLACKVKAFEKQHIKGMMSFTLVYAVGLPLTFYLGKPSTIIYCVGFGIFLPAVIESVWLYFYCRHHQMDKLHVSPVAKAS